MNTEPTTQTAEAAQAVATARPDAVAAATQGLDVNLAHWGYLALTILVAYIIGKIIGMVFNLVAERLKQKGRPASAALASAAGHTMGFFLLVVGLAIGLRFISIPYAFQSVVSMSVDILFACVGGLFAWRLVEVAAAAFESYASKTPSKMDDMLVPIIRNGLRIVVVVLFVVQVVQIASHQELSSVLAGLGIGGLAVALAAQDSIKNIFGSIIIIGDKPFMIDERITVDSVDGVVEQVGLRSTRIRTLTGSLVTIPNGELANKTIENLGRRERLRRNFNITLTYDTTPEKILRAKEIVAEILAVGPKQGGRTEGGDVQNQAFLPRIFFSEFADFSLNIVVYYWYNSTDYWAYMSYGEWFNLELMKRFNAEGIEMAYPTQTIYLAGDAKRPLNIGTPSTGNAKA
jgi:MscS family membrane protein